MHHEIVALEEHQQPLPIHGFTFPASTTHHLTAYKTTSTREELHSRIHDATIIITTTMFDAEYLQIIFLNVPRYLSLLWKLGVGCRSLTLNSALLNHTFKDFD
jgi:glycerate dehydrogenase